MRFRVIFFKIVIIFAFGTTFGWLLETVYKFILGGGKAVNPGFLSGPFVPIYGFGCLALYGLSYFKIYIVYRLVLFFISTTVLEYLTGLFFLNYFKLRLWDYRENRLNIQGLVCLRFSIYWTILSTIFYIFLFPILTNISLSIIANMFLIFILGLYYGIFITDLILSFDLASKLKILIQNNIDKERRLLKGAQELSIDLRSINLHKFKKEVLVSFKSILGEKTLLKKLLPFTSSRHLNLKENLTKYFDKIKNNTD